MNKFSDAEVRDYASRVLTLLNVQREYYRQPSRPKLLRCKKLEGELRKLTESVLGEFQQLRIYQDGPELMLPD